VYVCLSFIDYYTIHPIAMQLWEVVEYTLAKISELVELLNSITNGGRGSVSFGANIVITIILNASAPIKFNYIF
jgi:hypothetical protein